MARYELNNSLNGIEIYFDSIPSVAIRDEIKAAGFRWNSSKKCWYAAQTEEHMKIAKKMAAGIPENQPEKKTVDPNGAVTGMVEPPMTRKYCYADTVENFLGTEKNT